MPSYHLLERSQSPQKPEDVTAKVIGDFGLWQFQISFLMALLKLPNAWYQLNIIFMTPPQEFWCEKPKSFSMYTDEEWKKMSTPWIEEHPCLIFNPDLLKLKIRRRYIPLVPCQKFIYDLSTFSRTMTAEWDLVCSKHWWTHIPFLLVAAVVHFAAFWLSSPICNRPIGLSIVVSAFAWNEMTQFIMMGGVLLGSLVFGYLADIYGRRKPLMITIIVQALASYIVSFIPSFKGFLIVWFILAMASGGLSLINFVITMEIVSGKWRTVVLIIYYVPFGLGNAVMAGLAYWLRDWRKLELALASISSLYALYWFWIPESPRWLIASGRTDEALDVLKLAAKRNKRHFDPNEVNAMLLRNVPPKIEVPGFKAFLKSKKMRMVTLLLSGSWLCMGIAFYTFSQYLGLIGDNIFLTVAITGIISAPGALVCVVLINKFKRRTVLWIFQFFTGLCFLLLLIMPKKTFNSDWPMLLVAGSGYAGMAGSVPTLFLYTGELYPTLGRNVGVGGTTLFAKIGSMIAPAIVGLNDIVPALPLVLLVIMCFAQMLFLLPLPETAGCALPNTLEEAENAAQ